MKLSNSTALAAIAASTVFAAPEPSVVPHKLDADHTSLTHARRQAASSSASVRGVTGSTQTPVITTAPTAKPSRSVSAHGRCYSDDGDCVLFHTRPHSTTWNGSSHGAIVNSTAVAVHTNSSTSQTQAKGRWETFTHTNGWNQTHTHTLFNDPSTANSTKLTFSNSTSAPASTTLPGVRTNWILEVQATSSATTVTVLPEVASAMPVGTPPGIASTVMPSVVMATFTMPGDTSPSTTSTVTPSLAERGVPVEINQGRLPVSPDLVHSKGPWWTNVTGNFSLHAFAVPPMLQSTTHKASTT